MDYPDFTNQYLKITREQLLHFKDLGEKTFAQLKEDEFHLATDSDNSSSIAVLIQHLAGNMKSRWTDFLTTDGEKPSRKRDQEFKKIKHSKAELITIWEEGWNILFDALNQVNDSNLSSLIFIRGEGRTVLAAIQKQLGHYASHVGQIIYQAKIIKGDQFKSLSIPLGASAAYFDQLELQRELRILVPIDFSDTSKNALTFAIDLAGHVSARIWVMHIVYPHLNPGVTIGDERLQNQVEQAKTRLDKFLATIDTKGIQVDGSIEVGFVVDQILETEKKKKIDLLLLGNTGIGHGQVNAFGSTAAELAFKSGSKVLLVPLKSTFNPPKLLVLANDQSKIKLSQVEEAMNFCSKIEAQLELVHVGKPAAREAKSVFENLLDTLALPIKHTLSNQNVNTILDALNEYAEDRSADWMVMVAIERSFWKKILRPDVGKDIVGSTERPLLVIR